MVFELAAPRGLSLDGSRACDGYVQSLARGLAVMCAFRPGSERLTMAEVARAAQLPRPAAGRILLTLHNLGYVGIDGRYFYLTAQASDLSRRYLDQALWEATRPELERVARDLNETTSAGTLDGLDLVYTVRVQSSRPLQYELEPGSHLTAHTCSMGQVLLAALPPVELASYMRQVVFQTYTPHTISNREDLGRRLEQIRAQGWVWARGEINEDNDGVAVPLVGPDGDTLAALSINIDVDRATVECIEGRVVPRLKQAAASIAAKL